MFVIDFSVFVEVLYRIEAFIQITLLVDKNGLVILVDQQYVLQ